MPNHQLHWYAFLVRPGREYIAALALERQFGAETYVPTETRWRRKNRYCKAKVEVPFTVTPRYVLAGFAGTVHWLDVMAVPSISGTINDNGAPVELDQRTAILDQSGRPVRLTTAMLRRYMQTTPNGRLDPTKKAVVTTAHAPSEQRWMRTHREFKVGDRVEVVDGPFRDRLARVVAIDGPMARLDLTLFGGAPVEVPTTSLEAA